jgi:GNAT superfamily N-acetyltransferase
MAINYQIRPYDKRIAAAYPRLFSDDVSEKTPARLAWRFRSNPHGEALFATAEDMDVNGQLAGIIALMPTRLRISGGRLVSCVQAMDTVVGDGYRGHGVFVKLGQAIYADLPSYGPIAVWGFPNANAAPGWFGKLQWNRFGTVPFLFRPLRSGYFARRASPALHWLDIPLISRAALRLPSYRDISQFDDRATALWRDFSTTIGCAVDRSADWLNWRLFDRPESNYSVTGDFDGNEGLKAFVASCVLEKHGGRICYVMEAMSGRGHASSLSTLIRSALVSAAKEGAEIALAWCPRGAPNRAAYLAAGFLPLPDRLRPLEINFGSKTLTPEAPDAIAEAQAWYLSYLDSDTV